MFQKIIAFFMSIIAFFTSLFSGGTGGADRVYKDVSYGSDSRNVMDLYLPENEGDCGLVLMIHGGGWIAGDKSAYSSTAQYAAENLGVAAMSISYRYISENVDVWDIVDDITAALTKACEIALSKNRRLTKLMTMGCSAGGHLALLYAYSQKNVSPVLPVCVADYSGPVDLTNSGYYYGNSFGDTDTLCTLLGWLSGTTFNTDTFESAREKLSAASPIAYVSGAVPTAIAHGALDTTVPYTEALTLKAALDARSVRCDLVTYPNSDHNLTNDGTAESTFNDLLIEYVNTYLK